MRCGFCSPRKWKSDSFKTGVTIFPRLATSLDRKLRWSYHHTYLRKNTQEKLDLLLDHKVLNEERESRSYHKCAIVVEDLATQWIQSYPCKKQQLHNKRREIYGSVSIVKKFQELKTLTIHWHDGNDCEDLQWNHSTSTLHRSETNGIAECAARRVKETPRLFFCSPDSMNNGGQILWNVIATYALSKISYQNGKLHMNGVLKNRSKV